MSKLIKTVLVSSLLATSAAYAVTNDLGWTLNSALKQIERQADDFDTALADVAIRWTDEDGSITRERTGRAYINSKGEIRFAEFESGNHVILVSRKEVQDYDATRALVERYSLSKHKDRLEPYARLGFTTTGKDLKDDYLVTLLGEDQMGDRRVVGLELTPKKEKAREIVANLRLWIDQASWMPVRQEIVHVTSGETLSITYTGMARNLKLNDQLFKDRWPKGTQKIKR